VPSQVHHTLEGPNGSVPPPHPLVDWLENTEREVVTPPADMSAGVVGMILHHPSVDPLPLRSGFLHGRIGLFVGQQHFCSGFQYTSG